MGGWRKKLVVLLVFYFAGFASAIYCLAPVPKGKSPKQKGFVQAVFKSDEFAVSFNEGMHKCLDFAKDVADKAGKYVKQKMDERQQS